MHSIKNLRQQILDSKTIAIIGHQNPDTDCLASIISIKRMIDSFLHLEEKQIDIFCDYENLDEIYQPIVKIENFFAKIRNKIRIYQIYFSLF